jgi:hypothetical protein
MKQKISTFLLIILSILYILQCTNKKKDENIGEWKYKIFINGNNAGIAIVKISTNGDNYIHELEMETTTGDIKNTSRKKLVETKDYKPVSLEIINKIISNNDIQEIKTIVNAKEDGVDVISDNNRFFVPIERPFIFDGLYHTAELKKIRFKKGDLIKSRIFDPQIENESSVILNTAVSGKKKFTIRDKEIELFHVLQFINNLKAIEMYMDSRGTIYKSKTTMLNYTMEMILE